MARLRFLAGTFTLLVVACSTDMSMIPAPDAAAPDAAVADKCLVQPSLRTTHPYAAQQPTPLGRTLVDAIGWAGRLYWGFGDIVTNTGPIMIAAWDPASGLFTDRLLFDSEAVKRWRIIGDRLWAPASDPRGAADPEYSVAGMDQVFSAVSIGRSLHVADVVERVAGTVYLVGSDYYDQAAGTAGGAVWESISGQPFTRIFPMLPNLFDGTTYPFSEAAALDGKLYVVSVGGVWVYDGVNWTRGPDLGGFHKPVQFAGRIVFQALGKLWAFDGQTPRDTSIELLAQTGVYTASDGKLVVVDASHRTLMTTDLKAWTCLGAAPADVTSLGILNGTVYFGTAASTIYSYDKPSF